MGTNYYYRYKNCECCNRYVELHIGKSSIGWTFSFHAIREGEIENMPSLKIESYKDWLKLYDDINGEIYNEYGEIISIKQFKELVKNKMKEKLTHTIYCQNSKNTYDKIYANENYFLDSEGHSFSYGEFL